MCLHHRAFVASRAAAKAQSPGSLSPLDAAPCSAIASWPCAAAACRRVYLFHSRIKHLTCSGPYTAVLRRVAPCSRRCRRAASRRTRVASARAGPGHRSHVHVCLVPRLTVAAPAITAPAIPRDAPAITAPRGISRVSWRDTPQYPTPANARGTLPRTHCKQPAVRTPPRGDPRPAADWAPGRAEQPGWRRMSRTHQRRKRHVT